ncbi:LacI family DNA-binding transcriptional regulator [Bifidobacterium sp. ESL0690]|uniref:LacI family DNA-binding transcriptional regulator n=1 Tax=Bifidobacterium sp. ESL0690 TaxID=2983214 RepID=UPI0023F70513|nr:LacI family DNA-binding transcriptional regulator [Bifidobacterium sp. ESL0690]WEV46065.1 LacI family DNA-binding transcriptional regulator [Bifidobacterium sp. ESL0690]
MVGNNSEYEEVSVQLVQKRKRPPSIRDVARLANVSVASVSRYLNSNPHLSDEKKNSIGRAVEVLNYHPNVVAQALNSNVLKTIAVLLTDFSLFGPIQMIQGIEDEARSHGYLVSVTLVGEDLKEAEEALDVVLMNKPTGCIVIDLDRGSLLHSLIPKIEQSVPTAVIGENSSTSKALAFGSFEGGYEMTKYLLGLGHRTVYHVSVPEDGSKYTRTRGWRRALREAGATVPRPILSTWKTDEAVGIGQSLADLPNVTAVFAGNDEIAVGIIRGILLSGKKVPEDISVAGFDGNPISVLSYPSITTWKQDFRGMGTRSVRYLLGDKNQQNSSDSSEGDVSEHLIKGESTAPPKQ